MAKAIATCAGLGLLVVGLAIVVSIYGAPIGVICVICAGGVLCYQLRDRFIAEYDDDVPLPSAKKLPVWTAPLLIAVGSVVVYFYGPVNGIWPAIAGVVVFVDSRSTRVRKKAVRRVPLKAYPNATKAPPAWLGPAMLGSSIFVFFANGPLSGGIMLLLGIVTMYQNRGKLDRKKFLESQRPVADFSFLKTDDNKTDSKAVTSREGMRPVDPPKSQAATQRRK